MFASILVFYDFFEVSTRVFILKILTNLTKSIKNKKIFETKILPNLSSLAPLIYLTGHTDIEKKNLNKIIHILYLIADSILDYYEENEVWLKFTENGILLKTYKLLDEYVQSIYKDQEFNHNIHIINHDTFKTIIKFLSIISTNSTEISNRLMEMSILDTIYKTLKIELESDIKKTNNQHLVFVELFPFILSLFPTKIDKRNTITDNDSIYYEYFSKNIMRLLINNFINISSISTTIKGLELIKIFLQISSKENLIKYMDASCFSNLIWSKNY